MSLQAKLSQFKSRFESGQPPFERVPASVHVTMKRAIDELVASGAGERVRRAGPAPAFELQGADGTTVRLADLLAGGPVVLSFYRGVWCPYCNLDLEELELHADAIRKHGAALVAITPQTPANSRKSIREHGLTYPILCDRGNAVAERYGLRFRVPDYLVEIYRQFGIELEKINGEGSLTLPMPARFVVDRSGKIRYAESHPDYTRRPEPSELLPVLDGLERAASA